MSENEPVPAEADNNRESIRCRYCGQRNQTRDNGGTAKCGRCRLPLSGEPHKKFADLNKHDYVHPADSRALAHNVVAELRDYALECLRFNARPRDAFAGARRGQSFEILGIAGRLFDLPEALDMARQALRRSRSQTVRGAIIFLEDYFKAREGMEVPDDIHTALLTVAETTDSRSTATGALNVLVETGEISDMEALDRLYDWKDKHHR